MTVIGVSRSQETNSALLPHSWVEEAKKFYSFSQIDLNKDIGKLVGIVDENRVKKIFNFAAQSMVGQSWEHPEDWMMTNVVSTTNLVKQLTTCKSLEKYIHVTTPEVYGTTDGWIMEHRNFRPSTPYAVSRAASDMIMDIYEKHFDFPVIMTRAANVYGPGQQLYRIIPRTILRLINNEKLELHGGGFSTRSFIFMEDVAEATLLLAERGKVGESYHISTDRLISIRDLVKMICEKLGRSFEGSVEIVGERIGKDSSYQLSSRKIRQQLNWKENVSLESGVDQTIDWVRKNLDALSKLPQDYIHKK